MTDDLTSSGFPDPIANPQAWHTFYIGNSPAPGIIPVGGISGFEREVGWDVAGGKGAKGATITRKTAPPTKGSIRIEISKAAEFAAWDSFLPLLKYTSVAADKQAVAIYHPSLVDVAVNSVVVAKISPWYHLGKQKYSRTISFIEWTPQPKKSIVSTPTRAKEVGKKPAGDPPDPVSDVKQAQIAQALALAQKLRNER